MYTVLEQGNVFSAHFTSIFDAHSIIYSVHVRTVTVVGRGCKGTMLLVLRLGLTFGHLFLFVPYLHQVKFAPNVGLILLKQDEQALHIKHDHYIIYMKAKPTASLPYEHPLASFINQLMTINQQ